MRIKPFRAVYPVFEQITSPDYLTENAKYLFHEFRDKGCYKHDETAALYIYQIEAGHVKHTGLVAINELNDFFSGKVLKHENTLSEKEDAQLTLFMQWNAVLKPVLLTYPAVPALSHWLQDYTRKHKSFFYTRFENDRQTHRVWAIRDAADIQTLQDLFSANVHLTYIADGHHRTTTLALLHEKYGNTRPEYDFDHLFCAFFATDQLDILDFNRVVDGLDQIGPIAMTAKLSRLFDIEPLDTPQRPTQKHELTLCMRKEWLRLRWKPEVIARYDTGHVVLDAVLLNELVLRDILGIEDVRTDTRITYIDGGKGIKGLRKLTNKSKNRMGIMLYPVAFDDMLRMADAGDSLPPKSTYFSPRLKSGILVQSLLADGNSLKG